MSALNDPSAILSKPRGCMMLHHGSGGAVLKVRETVFGMGNYPRQCPVQLRLCSWDIPPAILVVVMVRFNKSDLLTYQTWLDCGTSPGVALLTSFAELRQIEVQLVTDRPERVFRVPNVLGRKARRLLDRLSCERQAWPSDIFEKAREQLDRLYTTSADLWHNAPGDR